MKCGQMIQIGEHRYMFLGWSDYKKRIAVLADWHGNKHTQYLK